MPAPRNNDASDITSQVLLVVSRKESERNGIEIRCIDWIKGEKHYPQLEKREFFRSETGWKIGKAKGFNREDLLSVFGSLDRIAPALHIAPHELKSALMDAFDKIDGAAAAAPTVTRAPEPYPAAKPPKEERDDF